MTSISQREEYQGVEVEQFDSDPWAQQLNYQWEICFEQCEPTIEDEVVQITIGDKKHPRPVFISNDLSLEKRQNLISLIREYIDVFAWSYEDIPGLDPPITMHRLNIKTDAKLLK